MEHARCRDRLRRSKCVTGILEHTMRGRNHPLGKRRAINVPSKGLDRLVGSGVAKSHREVTFYYFHNTYYTTLLTYPREIKNSENTSAYDESGPVLTKGLDFDSHSPRRVGFWSSHDSTLRFSYCAMMSLIIESPLPGVFTL